MKNLFLIFRKNDKDKEWQKKLDLLGRNIEALEKTIQLLQEQTKPSQAMKTNDPPIIIEKINIEKIILDKYELNNNLGQLGIKELKGRLNIGASYGSEFTPKFAEEEEKEKTKQHKIADAKPTERGPKINIQAKKD